jgi:His-Xaa-Ser system protein HxsD
MFFLDGDSVRLVLDTRLYRLIAIQKAGYRLAQRFTLVLNSQEGAMVRATLLLTPGGVQNAQDCVSAFYRELADQELREGLAEQTKDIRALLLAHAFSRTDLVRRQ